MSITVVKGVALASLLMSLMVHGKNISKGCLIFPSPYHGYCAVLTVIHSEGLVTTACFKEQTYCN